MDNTSALVKAIDIGLPAEKLTSLERAIRRSEIAQLSPDKEAGPFLLYMMGNSFETIAQKTSYPIDIIYITAIYYNWPKKVMSVRDVAEKEGVAVDAPMVRVQKDLVNSILVATYCAAQKELGDVIAGRIEASKCRFIPKNIHSLEKLILMANAHNNPIPEQNNINKGTVINSQNVQVIQSTPEKVIVEKEDEIKQMSQLMKERE